MSMAKSRSCEQKIKHRIFERRIVAPNFFHIKRHCNTVVCLGNII